MISRRSLRLVWGALALAIIAFHQAPADAADAATLLQEMEAVRPNWLPDLDECPADVMPARETIPEYGKEHCVTRLEQCLHKCQGGLAADCYASALVLQEVRNNEVRNNSVSDALFLRACALGIMSGCTNRAASMDEGRGDRCATRTYEMGCDRDDPWACTMIGLHLIRGIGVAKDRERARQALSKSCRFGETDPACGYAKTLMREIGD